jgi:SAM-dependent methyltransferase
MSLQTQHDPKNEAEITYWNSAGGRRWVERQQSQDIVLAPILQATLERAQLRQGERVVDIGCGAGASSIALAERGGPSGQVLGVDVSAPMLARAAERLPPGAPVKFVRADATTYRFVPTRGPAGKRSCSLRRRKIRRAARSTASAFACRHSR